MGSIVEKKIQKFKEKTKILEEILEELRDGTKEREN